MQQSIISSLFLYCHVQILLFWLYLINKYFTLNTKVVLHYKLVSLLFINKKLFVSYLERHFCNQSESNKCDEVRSRLVYDSFIVVLFMQMPFWPYTSDYKFPHDYESRYIKFYCFSIHFQDR